MTHLNQPLRVIYLPHMHCCTGA